MRRLRYGRGWRSLSLGSLGLVVAIIATALTPGHGRVALAATPGLTHPCQAYGAGGWAFFSVVKVPDGLVVYAPRFGPRLLATSLRTPYLEITADWSGMGQLSAKRLALGESLVAYGGLPAPTLIDYSCGTRGADSIGVAATFDVQGLPAGINMWVRQDYRFDRPKQGDACEATGKLPCARFWPTVTWGADDANPSGRAFIHDVRIVQQFDFKPDDLPGGAGDVFRDTDTGATTLSSGTAMKYEDRVLAIAHGQRKGHTWDNPRTWDSYHQTGRDALGGPGMNPFSLHPGFHPGCSECVHGVCFVTHE